MAEFRGTHVQISLANTDEKYEGFVHALDEATGRLTLEKGRFNYVFAY